MRAATRPRDPVITTVEWFTTRLYPEAAVDPVPWTPPALRTQPMATSPAPGSPYKIRAVYIALTAGTVFVVRRTLAPGPTEPRA